MKDRCFLHHCLSLAERGRGKTGINPLVGALLVRDEKIIAEGWHAGFGLPHAEKMLFNSLNEQKICSDDILYVTLEPCCHANKKTLPCAQMLIERGIKKVVYGMQDPNPEVSGKGIAMLRDAGIEVIGPVLIAECLRMNRGFVSLMTKSRPWITLKKAIASDGRIANTDGSPLKITSVEQDAWAHHNLRATHDAILVGVGTIISDDPKLTARCTLPLPLGEGRGEGTQPYRIILDPHLRISLDAKVVTDEWRERTIVITNEKLKMKNEELQKKKKILEHSGIKILEIPYNNHHFDWDSLWKVLTTPVDQFYGISSILVEGGPKTWESFQSGGMVDEEVVLVGRR